VAVILKGLFAPEPFSFSGKYFSIKELDGTPKPAQLPRPPIMIGGGGPKLLAVAPRQPSPSREEILSSPVVAIGSLERVCDKLMQVRDSFGFSYFACPVLAKPASLAPVIERLAGQ